MLTRVGFGGRLNTFERVMSIATRDLCLRRKIAGTKNTPICGGSQKAQLGVNISDKSTAPKTTCFLGVHVFSNNCPDPVRWHDIIRFVVHRFMYFAQHLFREH